MKEITVEWTGRCPSLCFGKWLIRVDGIKVVGLGDDDFNTHGCYPYWFFVDLVEQFEDSESGDSFEDWDRNTNNLERCLKEQGIKLTEQEWLDLYNKINGQDWRRNSCGGCI